MDELSIKYKWLDTKIILDRFCITGIRNDQLAYLSGKLRTSANMHEIETYVRSHNRFSS